MHLPGVHLLSALLETLAQLVVSEITDICSPPLRFLPVWGPTDMEVRYHSHNGASIPVVAAASVTPTLGVRRKEEGRGRGLLKQGSVFSYMEREIFPRD